MATPLHLALRLERRRTLPPGSDERFSGYGVVGLPFASGHLLALRRFVASSIGPAFTSVWHRDPQGRWTFYMDVEPELGCARYFGPAIHDFRRDEIEVCWLGPHELAVHVVDAGLHWAVRLAASPVTRALSSAAASIPPRLWNVPGVPELVGSVGGLLLGTGPLRLRGTAPSGRAWQVQPSSLFLVRGSAAVLGNRELGDARFAAEAPSRGDFPLPRIGLFAFGTSRFSSA